MINLRIKENDLSSSSRSPCDSATKSHIIYQKVKKASSLATASIPIVLLFLNIWRVPIVILVASASAQPTFAGSIASINLGNPINTQQKPPNKITLNSNEGKAGLSLSLGGIVLSNKYPLQPSQPKYLLQEKADSSETKTLGKRAASGGTRIISNQDVTTLAVAMENSSSIAVANINSSYNNIFVQIGGQQYKFQ